MIQVMKQLLGVSLVSSVLCVANAQYNGNKPNLVVVYTDEHNFRTIGAYRELLGKANAEIWGENVVVDTPNLDRLANEGAIFTSMYTVAPLCTPSRASFMTGLYPKATGAWLNHNAMSADMITWAQFLRQKRGYYTGYVGKWHLDGDAKPGFNSGKARQFGFTETKWRYNRGHWKFFDAIDGKQQAYEWDEKINDASGSQEAYKKFEGNMERHYATDFLMNKGIGIIERSIEMKSPFAVMISIPDPHSPNIVRSPYDTMYNKFKFKVPATAKAALKKQPSLPGWSSLNININEAWPTIEEKENDENRHRYFRNIFGMVKLVDDNIGKLLNFLDEKGVGDNTIIVFSSDHGDMLGEHAKHNKGKPYETSAGVPFLMRWPNGIPKGRVIDTAYSSIDFAPTVLSMMGVNYDKNFFHGIDGSDEVMADPSEKPWLFKNGGKLDDTDRQTRFMSDSQQGKWASAVRNNYKLVVSKGEPWLFDLGEDPQELHNVYGQTNYTTVGEEMQDELLDTMFKHGFPLTTDADVVLWSKPACWDSRDEISMWKKRECSELSDPRYSPGCQWRPIYEQCPVVCKRCCEDSKGQILVNGKLETCASITKHQCEVYGKISNFCPVTCGACPGEKIVDPEISAYSWFDGDDDWDKGSGSSSTDGDDYAWR